MFSSFDLKKKKLYPFDTFFVAFGFHLSQFPAITCSVVCGNLKNPYTNNSYYRGEKEKTELIRPFLITMQIGTLGDRWPMSATSTTKIYDPATENGL